MSEYFNRAMKHAFLEALGLEIEERAPGEVVVRLPEVGPEHVGGAGTDALNGMVIAAIFDGALGAALLSLLIARSETEGTDIKEIGQATINLEISYIRLATGSSFEVHGSVLRLGSDIAFTEGKLYDKAGSLCATANASFYIFHDRAALIARSKASD